MGSWQQLGAVDPEGLVDARLLVHHAAQLVPRLVRGRVPAEPGFAHLALAWEPAPGALAGRPGSPGPARGGPRPGAARRTRSDRHLPPGRAHGPRRRGLARRPRLR